MPTPNPSDTPLTDTAIMPFLGRDGVGIEFARQLERTLNQLRQTHEETRRLFMELQTLWEFLPEVENKYMDRLHFHLRELISKKDKERDQLKAEVEKWRNGQVTEEMLRKQDGNIHIGKDCSIVATRDWEELKAEVDKLERAIESKDEDYLNLIGLVGKWKACAGKLKDALYPLAYHTGSIMLAIEVQPDDTEHTISANHVKNARSVIAEFEKLKEGE